MSVRKYLLTAALFLFVTAANPSTAAAEWWFTPFIGTSFGGSAELADVTDELEVEFERRLTYGATLTWLGDGAIGFEIDFGYAPNFFQSGTVDDDEFEFAGDSNVTTLMANLVLAGRGNIRPYASGGVGLIRTSLSDPEDFFDFDDLSTNDFGFNVGGGVGGFFSENIGIRGDVRYFRSLQDDEPDDEFDISVGQFRFWRGTVGVIFRF